MIFQCCQNKSQSHHHTFKSTKGSGLCLPLPLSIPTALCIPFNLSVPQSFKHVCPFPPVYISGCLHLEGSPSSLLYLPLSEEERLFNFQTLLLPYATSPASQSKSGPPVIYFHQSIFFPGDMTQFVIDYSLSD